MKKLKYNKHEFEVKANTLGIGKTISELSAQFEDNLMIAQYHIVRLPDYGAYQLAINNIGVLMNDLAELNEKLSTAKGKDKTELTKAIATDKKAIDIENKALQKPALSFIMNRMLNIRKEVMFGFKNDTEIFKTLCGLLLLGDTSVIDFSNADKSLMELRDGVYAVFFSIKSSIYA